MKKFLKVNGKIVGDYDSDKKKYTKKVQRSKHKLWKYDAYGINLDVIKELKKLGCYQVEIKEIDTGELYVSLLGDWIEAKSEDLGHGMQKFMPVTEMRHFYDVPPIKS